jgi:hypothetical protein
MLLQEPAVFQVHVTAVALSGALTAFVRVQALGCCGGTGACCTRQSASAFARSSGAMAPQVPCDRLQQRRTTETIQRALRDGAPWAGLRPGLL